MNTAGFERIAAEQSPVGGISNFEDYYNSVIKYCREHFGKDKWDKDVWTDYSPDVINTIYDDWVAQRESDCGPNGSAISWNQMVERAANKVAVL